jgi:hypothetical protein
LTQKIFRSRKYRRFRNDKRRFAYRDSITTVTETPTGRIIERKTAVYKTDRHIVPKKENGIWETVFHYGRFQIRRSRTTDRYFIYYDDRYLEEISRPEMYSFFKRGLQSIGAFREVVHDFRKGRAYMVLQLVAKSRFK